MTGIVSPLDAARGRALRDSGINAALNNANNTHDQWSDRAYVFLLDYIKSRDFYNREFMTEDVRVASESELPAPPDKRAWGGIVVRAAKAGLIQRIGYSHVKNVKAHRTPAAVWRVVTA